MKNEIMKNEKCNKRLWKLWKMKNENENYKIMYEKLNYEKL